LFGRKSESDGAIVGADVAGASGAETGGASCDDLAESLEEVWFARFAVTVLTGLRIHRLTWRLRLDATPKRRPQVSQTNAINITFRIMERQQNRWPRTFLSCVHE
jgi:hypothetical protein